MKLLFLGCLIFFLSLRCSAEVPRDSALVNAYKLKQPHQFVIKTNPLAVVVGGLPYVAEYRVIAEATNGLRQSEQFAISYLGKGILLSLAENLGSRGGATLKYSVSGVRVQGAYKYYVGKKTAPTGLYLALHLSYSTAHIVEHVGTLDHTINESNFNGNVLFGDQFIFKNRMVLDLFLGLGTKKTTWSERWSGHYNQGLAPPYYFQGVANFMLGGSVGFSF